MITLTIILLTLLAIVVMAVIGGLSLLIAVGDIIIGAAIIYFVVRALVFRR